MSLPPLESSHLPTGVRARFVDGVNGLRMHVLEAGYESPDRPLVVLLHGFPELAFSWRDVIVPLADAGFHVVAPDQRGYGRTTGWSDAYDQDLRSFSMLNLARDVLSLVRALGRERVHTLVGHDFGSPVAGWCALLRPDVFRSVVMMSAPFTGAPPLGKPSTDADRALEADLASLETPRKHYQWYYATRAADADMRHAPQGLSAFLRAYFHYKSADWPENRPYRLGGWTATELAKLPTYYVMDRDRTMAETVAPFMPSPEAVATCRWLTEADLAVYAEEFGRTGFQGGLNWYRTRFDATLQADLSLFDGQTIDVPAMFVAGASDWGIHQVPGALERMQTEACTRMAGCHLVAGAGHWVMQEQPRVVNDLLVSFCRAAKA